MTDLEATAVDLSRPITMRWPPALLARADALAAVAGPGITRSVILRMACENGMAAVEDTLTKLAPSRLTPASR